MPWPEPGAVYMVLSYPLGLGLTSKNVVREGFYSLADVIKGLHPVA